MSKHHHKALPLPQGSVLSASFDLRREDCACGAHRYWVDRGWTSWRKEPTT